MHYIYKTEEIVESKEASGLKNDFP